MADQTPVDQPASPPAASTPGWKTTEFWLHVAAQAIAFLVAIGLLASDRADAVLKAVGAVVAAIGSVGGAVVYSNNRTNLKSLE